MKERDDDLSLTVRELSNAYEELTLLYRMADLFCSLSVDEICSRLVTEALSTVEVRTAAILLVDERGEKLLTKASLGGWDAKREFGKDDGVLWKSVEARKASAFCRLEDTPFKDVFPEFTFLLVCPLPGKGKAIGAVVVADKVNGQEFYSNDLKLLMAISAQAGMAIENALLHQELETLLLGSIRSLIKAQEATSFWTAGHTERVTAYSLEIGRVMGLSCENLEKLKISALLHDIGKIATPREILNKEGKLGVGEWAEVRRHPGQGAEILGEMKQFQDVILAIKYHHEHWDGREGVFRLKGQEIPVMARILAVADAFDAMTSDRPYRKRKSKEHAVKEIVRCSGTQFDPSVVDAFVVWAERFSLPHQVS